MDTYWAVDVGGTKVEAGIGTEDGTWLVTRRVATQDFGTGPSVVDVLADLLRNMARDAQLDVPPAAVAVGCPGPLDTRAGRILKPANVPGWHDLPIVEALGGALGVPVYLENDATAAALGEWRFGAGRGYDDMVYVTVSTGIGAGIVSGGRLVEGVDRNAGEIGHVVIEPDGLPCHCGLRGCFETVASGTGIARQGEARRGESAALSATPGPVDAPAVMTAAQAGDAVAAAIMARVTDRLAWGVGTLINLFNPARVVLGGGVVVGGGEWLLAQVRANLPRYAMPDLLKRADLVPAALGGNAGIAGALAVALVRTRA